MSLLVHLRRPSCVQSHNCTGGEARARPFSQLPLTDNPLWAFFCDFGLTRWKGLAATPNTLDHPLSSLGSRIHAPSSRLCCGTFVCTRSWQHAVSLGLHPLHPVMEVGPALGGRWQELNAGRAAARPRREQGTQLKVLRLPGSAQLSKPLRPLGKVQGSFPTQAPSAHPLTVSWRCWPTRGFHVSSSRGTWCHDGVLFSLRDA